MKISTLLTRAVTVVAVFGGAYLLYRNLSRYSFEELMQSIYAIPLGDGLIAFGFVILSYLSLAGFDGTGLAYVGKRIAAPKVMLTSFTALSIGHNVGVSLLSSAAVRYRFYSRWGLSAVEVGQVVVFCGFTVALGITTLAGVTLLLPFGETRTLDFLGPVAAKAVAAAVLLFPISYVLAARFLPRQVHFWKWDVRVPDWRLALAQVVIGTVNFTFVAASLYFLLRHGTDVRFIDVASGYAVANMLAIISHVPGGLGVLEAGLVYALPGDVPFGVLIAFRILYFFIPLAIGLPLFLISEAWNLRRSGGDGESQRKNEEVSRLSRRTSEPGQATSR